MKLISAFKNPRILLTLIGLFFVGTIATAGLLYFADSTWEDNATWKNPQFTYFDPGQEAGELKLIKRSHNDGSQLVEIQNCTLFKAVTENDTTTYYCSSVPLAEVVRNPRITDEVSTHIMTFTYKKDQEPIPTTYLELDSLSEYSFIGGISDPVQVNFSVNFSQKKPEKNLVASLQHFWMYYIEKKQNNYVTDIISWEATTQKTISQLTFYPTPNNISETVDAPWGYADDEINPAPTAPSVQELESTFIAVIKSVEERNFQLFSENSAQSRVWLTSNNGELVGYTDKGERVFYHRGQTGQENWKENAACGIYASSFHPQVNGVVIVPFGQPRLFSPGDLIPDSQGKYIFVFPDKSAKYIEQTVWRYQLVQTFYAKQGENLIAKADVAFVYDKGKWRYYGGLWEYNYDMGGTYGADLQKAVYDGNKTNRYPQVIEIKSGEGVSWKNLYGMVSATTSLAGKYWGSMTLQGGTYSKIFDVPGEYSYKICMSENEFTGKVIVK
jgi:plastocyanin